MMQSDRYDQPQTDARPEGNLGSRDAESPLTHSRQDRASGPRWWLPWLGVVGLIVFAAILPRVNPDLAAVRRQMRAQRCREQMLALAAGEVQHYLDHRSFTTEQEALTRYVPYAEYARCPSCGSPYVLEVTRDRATVRCPCEDTRHGWVEKQAPLLPDSIPPD